MRRAISQMRNRRATPSDTTRKFISGVYNEYESFVPNGRAQGTKPQSLAVERTGPQHFRGHSLRRSTVLPIKSCDFTHRLAVDSALFEICPLLSGVFALPHSPFTFYSL